MANIRVELAELKKLQQRSIEIHEGSTKVLNAWKTEVENVISNLEQGTPLGGASEKLLKALVNLTETVDIKYLKISNFLKSQVDSYDVTQSEAKDYLNKLISDFKSNLPNA